LENKMRENFNSFFKPSYFGNFQVISQKFLPKFQSFFFSLNIQTKLHPKKEHHQGQLCKFERTSEKERHCREIERESSSSRLFVLYTNTRDSKQNQI
jgi:hypothetical protein